MNKFLLFALWASIGALSSCKTSYLALPAMGPEGHPQAVIEIPAGTNHKMEINKSTGRMEVDIKDGKPRVVEFLPYPANYGFIPGTWMDPAKGGDGDALDILVIGESVPTGTVMEVIPLGLMVLEDGGETDNKLLAIPADPALQVIFAGSLEELNTRYPAVVAIVETWFLNYKGPGVMKLLSWQDEKAAMAEIERWRVSGRK